jgi:hypothetical protein
MSLSFTIAAGSCQRSHSNVRDPDSRLPRPGGPGPRIYIPQEKGGLVVTPGTGFPFHHLLRLAERRWRYSNPPSHGVDSWLLTACLAWLYSHGTELRETIVPNSVFNCCVHICCRGNLFIEPLPLNGQCKHVTLF